MTGDNFLLALAATSMALGGFTGLISAFRVGGGCWKPQDVAGMKLIFQHSLAAVFFCFLPFPIFHMFGSEKTTWVVSSVLLAFFLAFEFVLNAVEMTRLKIQGEPPRRPLALLLHFFPFTLLVFILELANVFLWSSAWPYFWGIFWLLQPPAVQFYYFISFIEDSGDDKSNTQIGKKGA